MTSQAAAALQGRFGELAAALRRRDVGRLVARTAGYNVISVAAAGLGGIVVARALGPQLRGEYAAVTSWLGVVTTVGEMGQPAAVCFFVARDPDHARDYVATSRALMVLSGAVAMVGGIALAPLLARGDPALALAYRVTFASSIAVFARCSYIFALQGRDLRLWNTVWVVQPVLGLASVVVLWRLRLLTLISALLAIAVTTLAQACWAYYRCRGVGLAPGRTRARLAQPLTRYGTAQIIALTPATINVYLDQLVLSQVVPPAVLGRYAIAVTCTLLPMPLVSAVGNVAFPWLASRTRVDRLARQMQWLGILGSAGAAAAALVPLDLVAPWLIPRVFGPAYTGMTPLLWALTPAGVLMACNQVAGDVLRGRKRPLVVASSQGVAAVFTVALLIALLPAYGVYGAAIASAVAYGIALLVMLASLRCLPASEAGPQHRRRPAHAASHRKKLV